MDSARFGWDPSYWPIVTRPYRHRSTYSDNTVCTIFRYDSSYDYKLVCQEPDPYCYYCDDALLGSFGVILYIRNNRTTIPIYICVGCIGNSQVVDRYTRWDRWDPPRPLVWHPGISPDFNSIVSRDTRSTQLLDTLNEYYSAIRHVQLGDYDPPDVPDEYYRLLKLAKKL
jgi:hypothetical protein